MIKLVAAILVAFAAILLSFTNAPAASARQYDIVKALPAAAVGKLHVTDVEVTLGDEALTTMAAHDAKAAGKRVAAGLAAPSTARPAQDEYATIPFARMFPLVMQDVTARWGLTSGRPVKLHVTIARFGTADAGKAMLFGGSPDTLYGLVEVQDAANGAILGLFTVNVVNRHTGWSGMLIRGGGIREKLSEEFALEAARVLSGRKSIKAKVSARK